MANPLLNTVETCRHWIQKASSFIPSNVVADAKTAYRMCEGKMSALRQRKSKVYHVANQKQTLFFLKRNFGTISKIYLLHLKEDFEFFFQIEHDMSVKGRKSAILL